MLVGGAGIQKHSLQGGSTRRPCGGAVPRSDSRRRPQTVRADRAGGGPGGIAAARRPEHPSRPFDSAQGRPRPRYNSRMKFNALLVAAIAAVAVPAAAQTPAKNPVTFTK